MAENINNLVDQVIGLSVIDASVFFEKFGDYFDKKADSYFNENDVDFDEKKNDLRSKLLAVAGSLYSVFDNLYVVSEFENPNPEKIEKAVNQASGLSFNDASVFLKSLSSRYGAEVVFYSSKANKNLVKHLSSVASSLSEAYVKLESAKTYDVPVQLTEN